MNVALTRAKLSLWIFGNARTLRTNQTWAALLVDANKRIFSFPLESPAVPSGSVNRSSPGNSLTAHLEEDERLKAGTKCVNKQEALIPTSERKRKGIGTAPQNVCNGDVSHSVKSDRIDEKRTRDESGTKFPLASAKIRNNDNQVLKGAMSKLQENQEKADRNQVIRDNDKQIRIVKADDGKDNYNDNVSKHSTNVEKVKSGSQKHPRPVPVEARSKTTNNRKLKEVKISSSSSEGRAKENGELEASDQSETLNDTIKKRKQQREAVDALLSSFLISSKKSDSVMKSSRKRTLSTNFNGLINRKTMHEWDF